MNAHGLFHLQTHFACNFEGIRAFQGKGWDTKWLGAVALSRLTHLLEGKTDKFMWQQWLDKRKAPHLNGKGETSWV